jgi:hypothetical protein
VVARVGLVGERDFLVQDYDQPWVRGRKYRISGVFWFWKKKPRSLRERDVVKHGAYTGLSLMKAK